jgi:hypothetical protein
MTTANGNGKPTTAAGMLSSLSEKVVSALPPQFLALVIVNVLFLGALFWFVDARAKHTADVLNQLLQACLSTQGIKP